MPSVTISENDAGQRLDRYLRRTLPAFPPSHIYKLLRTHKIRVKGKGASPDYRLQVGDIIIFHLPPDKLEEASRRRVRPATSIDFEIRFEDDHILVVSKPPFLPVHPGAGHPDNSLIDQVRAYLEVKPEDFQPALVHRLDRDTSGLIIVGKTYAAVRRLGAMMKNGEIQKSYLGLCWGVPKQEKGVWKFPVERRDQAGHLREDEEEEVGETHYRVALVRKLPDIDEKVSLLVLRLATGRTHQIRSHLLQAGHPLLGDKRYGEPEKNRWLKKRFNLRRQFLHAYRLRFIHPITGNPLRLADPYPADLRPLAEALSLGVPAD